MILQSVKMAFQSILSNKMRSFLTMLGIIIGVVSLVVLVSLVTGATNSITDQVSSLGTSMFTVSVIDDKGNPLRMDELNALAENEMFAAVAPAAQTNATAKHGYNDEMATVYGTTTDYMSIQGLSLQFGRFLKTTDVENSSYVAVLSYETADTLFGRIDVVGETLSLNGISFQIVGVLTENESMMMSMMGSDITVYVPYTVATRMSGQPSYVTTFYVAAADANNMDAAERELDTYLMHRFKEDENAFSIFNMSIITDTMSSITSVLSLLLGGIAAISLLVGGIGIMNIMLVSVTERTREIGIRKAIGAGRGVIMLQFLIEALALSLMGCMIGIVFSWAILGIVSMIAGSSLSFGMSAGVVFVSVAFSVAIGMLFGLYPANKAAKKNPIEALRYAG